jgi:hypothetical protein
VSAEALADFGKVVVNDPDLLRELLAAGDRLRFIDLVVQRAADRGWDVSVDDVANGLRDARRAWQERWV